MAMTTPETGDVDVVVAGAGPVGLVTALGLAQAGVTVHVLERDPEVGRAPRALVHSCTSHRSSRASRASACSRTPRPLAFPS